MANERTTHEGSTDLDSLSVTEAIALQEQLRSQVVRDDTFGHIRVVAGVDVAFDGDIATAAIAALSFPTMDVVQLVTSKRRVQFPYTPGLLGFREVPAVLDALVKLRDRPDMVLCDGNGIMHPRRFGFASHLGVLADIPSIGVAKTPFIGAYGEVGPSRGSWQPIRENNEVIGAALRTRVGTKPVYVSIGHRVGLETALDVVMTCAPKYRLPETTRLADQLSRGNVR